MGRQLTMKAFVFLFICLCNNAFGNIEETHKTCRAHHICLKIGECPPMKEKQDKMRLTRYSTSVEFGNLKRELREAVCNKNERAVCCPNPPSENIEKTEKTCIANHNCLKIEECPLFKEKHNNLRIAKPQSAEYKNLKQELKEAICNKKDRAVCCPPLKSSLTPPQFCQASDWEKSKPDYLPRFGCCGIPLIHLGSIVGGSDTRPGEFPFAALLGFAVKEYVGTSKGREIYNNKTQWSCGGTLINQWYVLTAAHCQGNIPETTIHKVRLGEWSVQGWGKEKTTGEHPDEQDFDIRVNDITVHEDFEKGLGRKFTNIVNDIALVKLPRPAKLNAGVQMACLPFDSQEFKNYLEISNVNSGVEERESTVIGWGKTNTDQLADYDGVGSRIMQKLQVPVLKQIKCNVFNFQRSQLCAGGELGKDSCRGDSGGGLFTHQEGQNGDITPWYLIGIVSFGSKDCGNGRPGVYTRVSSFIPWILNNLK